MSFKLEPQWPTRRSTPWRASFPPSAHSKPEISWQELARIRLVGHALLYRKPEKKKMQQSIADWAASRHRSSWKPLPCSSMSMNHSDTDLIAVLADQTGKGPTPCPSDLVAPTILRRWAGTWNSGPLMFSSPEVS